MLTQTIRLFIRIQSYPVNKVVVNIKELQELRNNAKTALAQPLRENGTLKCNFHIIILSFTSTRNLTEPLHMVQYPFMKHYCMIRISDHQLSSMII